LFTGYIALEICQRPASASCRRQGELLSVFLRIPAGCVLRIRAQINSKRGDWVASQRQQNWSTGVFVWYAYALCCLLCAGQYINIFFRFFKIWFWNVQQVEIVDIGGRAGVQTSSAARPRKKSSMCFLYSKSFRQNSLENKLFAED
jgi:hypothetical protein